MSDTKNTTTALWRTMNEPDIDPLMKKGLQTSQGFLKWLVIQCYPGINNPQLQSVRANDWRPCESGPRRETDLHVEVTDSQSTRYALLIESKVTAPASYGQPDAYSAYAKWGVKHGKWKNSVTVLMAPEGYLTSERSADKYERNISYESIEKASRREGLSCLADYLIAGVERYNHTGSARNPDDTIGAFRVKYTELIREERPDLYKKLRGKDRNQFDKSQTWMGFNMSNSDRINHYISNKQKSPQDRGEQQYLVVWANGMANRLSELPDFEFEKEFPAVKESAWRLPSGRRLTKGSNGIKEFLLPEDLWMFLDEFDADKARAVWKLAESLRDRWMSIVDAGTFQRK